MGDLGAAADRLRRGGAGSRTGTTGDGIADRVAPERPSTARAPLDREVRELEARFDEQLAGGRVADAVQTMLAMDQLLLDWSRDTDGTDEVDRARQAFRSLIVRLGERASRADAAAATDRLAPLVELLIELRGRARAARDFPGADTIRDALAAAGVELRDGADGTTWEARQDA